MNVGPLSGGSALNRGRLRRWAEGAFDRALQQNLRNIERLLASSAPARTMLDLGCGDGAYTQAFARAARAEDVHGIEIAEERAEAARARGIAVEIGDINESFPYSDGSFDVVVSNQVIEHLLDPENFVRETFRVLRSRGVIVASTENLASWHNIFSLVLGWEPFSTTNVSPSRLGIGNPLAIHRGTVRARHSLEHVRVFAYRGLRELFESYGFEVDAILGAGYYPLPPSVARLDRRHGAFLAIKATRPGSKRSP